MRLNKDVKILCSTIIIVLGILIWSHISSNGAIRTDLFLRGYFVKAFTTEIHKEKNLYYCKSPDICYSLKRKFGLLFIDNIGDP